MEQKKILWVILSISLFMLIIFGIALFLYSPSRNSAIALAGGETVPYEPGEDVATKVDPDRWAREPDRIAGLDKNIPPAAGNIINLNNLNIISTDGQGHQTKEIDVSDLTAQADETEDTGLPQELAEQIGINTKNDRIEEKPAENSEPAAAPASTPAVALAQSKTTVTVEKKAAQPASVKAKAKTSAAPVKSVVPQVKTLYWVQTASLADKINAERARDKLAAQHMKVEIFTKETAAGLTHRVRVGPFTNNTEAKYWLKSIQSIDGFEHSYVTEEKVRTNS